ncbi:MAG: hypothetical protein CSA45_05670 [Gammaproteobacteria bacterium]|nr:MAG: hypothetical protein CSA45_05670 [Gammaproteobacteria bacterium]
MKTQAGYPWHRSTLQHIKIQLAEDRLPHAMLYRQRNDYFDTALGWQVAQLLLCEAKNGQDNCRHCRLLAEKSHPNVLFLDVFNEKIGIDNVRDLEQQMWQTSVFDKAKIAYISGMDLLSIGAQNALLKTLEEPPKNAFFILSVNNLSRVLPTIISRVQRLRHSRLEQHTLLHWLQAQLNTTMTEAEIGKIAKLADFAPARTLALLQSPETVRQLQAEKAQFADFMAGKCTAATLAAGLDNAQSAAQLARYCRYTKSMIFFLFAKTSDKNCPDSNKKADKSTQYSVQYVTWNGVSLRALYRLHDALSDLWRLSETNVNLPLQFTTRLTDWQHDRKK